MHCGNPAGYSLAHGAAGDAGASPGGTETYARKDATMGTGAAAPPKGQTSEEVVPEDTPGSISDWSSVPKRTSCGLRGPARYGTSPPSASSLRRDVAVTASGVGIASARAAQPLPQGPGRPAAALRVPRETPSSRYAPSRSPEVHPKERKCLPTGGCSGSAMVGGSGTRHGLLENANPLIYERSGERPVTAGEEDEQVPDSIDAREIFDIRCCRARVRRGLGGGMK